MSGSEQQPGPGMPPANSQETQSHGASVTTRTSEGRGSGLNPVRHPVQALGEFFRTRPQRVVERNLGRLSHEEQSSVAQRVESRRQAERDALLERSTSVIGAETLPQETEARAVVEQRVRLAREGLVAQQKAEVDTAIADAKEKNGGSISQAQEDQIRADHEERYKAEDRVAVIHGGESIMVVRGRPDSYSLDLETGEMTIKTHEEPERDANGKVVDDPNNPGNPKMQEVASEVRLFTATYGSRTVEPGTRFEREQPTVRYLQKAGNSVESTPAQPLEENEVFRNLGGRMITMRYSHEGGYGSGANVYRLDIGDASPQIESRVYKTIAAAIEEGVDTDGNFKSPYGHPAEGDRSGSGKTLVIVGAGGEVLDIHDRPGLLHVANVTERWQIEGPQTGEGQSNRQSVDIVVRNETESRMLSQLPAAEARTLLGVGEGVNVNVYVNGGENVPTTAQEMSGRVRTSLETDSAKALARTTSILDGTMSEQHMREVTDPSLMVLVVGRGTEGFGTENAGDAMQAANGIVEDLTARVDAIYASDANKTAGESRQQIAQRLIDERFPREGRGDLGNAMAERLASTIGGRNDGERMLHVQTAQRAQNETPAQFRRRMALELHGVSGLQNEQIENLERMAERIRGEVVLPSAAEITANFAEAVVSDEGLTQETAAGMLGQIKQLREKGGLSDEDKALLDRTESNINKLVPQAAEAVTPQDALYSAFDRLSRRLQNVDPKDTAGMWIAVGEVLADLPDNLRQMVIAIASLGLRSVQQQQAATSGGAASRASQIPDEMAAAAGQDVPDAPVTSPATADVTS